ncbi:PilW family protein [Psychrobacter sp. FME5]|uniref:PilW family protein n=3 Tax=Psychrobacter TaxID=497 RepID=UPI00178868B9|nr:PilW family protein [Psychrobacter sp. FME5]MBE0446263.1 PilW family protein [Psychrobacter sp. FME5]
MWSSRTVRQGHNSTDRPYQQSGFTLIELMISLILGLIISAAAMQVYIINVKTSSIQASGSELQDASVFGLQQLERKVRLANLGNPETQITSATNKGGVVLTAANLGIATTPYTGMGYLTRRAGDSRGGTNGWTGISNIKDVPSDQLTIQYTNITGSRMNDCEGSTVELNDTVVERYFLRQKTDDTSSGDIKNLVLACDAGRVNLVGGVTELTDFGGIGQEFIANVDQFKVLLGMHFTKGANAGKMMYLPSSAYMKITDDKPAITAIKMGLIAHGSTPIVGSEDQTKFLLLGQDNTLETDTTRKNQVRNTYETTTLLRNARVVNIDTSLKPQ